MSDKVVMMTTASSTEEARRIADALVERRQAACVNIVKGVESIYRWKGKTEESQEWLLFIKTTAAAFDNVWKTIRELHSYELPECISVPINQGTPEYLKWIDEAVGKGEEKRGAGSESHRS
jgi:periplasmic divalent cation tolerance protein